MSTSMGLYGGCKKVLLMAVALTAGSLSQAQLVTTKVDGVLNAASYAVTGLPHSDIAQGSMFVVFGQRLGPAALQQAQPFPYPTQLAGSSIRVTGGGVTADAVMIYTSAGQVAAILPSQIPPGDATITATYGSQTSPPVQIRVARSSFGIFTRNQAGSGPGIVQNYVSPTNQPVNALTGTAHPGQVMILWGTGLGPVDFDETQPPQVRNLDVDLDVLVGGKSARVLYKGRSAQFPGVDQINFELPADAPEGCHVPIAIRAGTTVSNFASIAIASQGTVCSDPIGLSASEMERVRSTGQLRTGQIVLEKTTVKELNGLLDNAGASFDLYDYDTVLKALSVGNQAAEDEDHIVPFGTCIGKSGRVPADDLELPSDPTRPQGFDAGTVLTLRGPRGVKQILRGGGSGYGADLGGEIPGFSDNYGPEYLVPGVYMVDNGTGSRDVRPFTATLTLPALINWTNQDSFTTISRSQDLTVTWSGGDAAQEYVVIFGFSGDTTREVAAGFTCVERASAGRFTVPSWVLSTLPASGMLTASIPKGILGVNTYSILGATKFQAQGLDVGSFGYEIVNYKLVTYQ